MKDRFEQTCTLFYKRASARVEKQKKEKKLTIETIYENDPKMISRIVNTRRGKNNPYLITPKVGLAIVEALDFDSEYALYWGTEEEIEKLATKIFECIIRDMLAESGELFNKIHAVLIDYVPYAKWSVFFNIYGDDTDMFEFFHGTGKLDSSVSLFEKLFCNAIPKAIHRLYNTHFEETFPEDFINFTHEETADSNKGFKKLPDRLEAFVQEKILPVLDGILPLRNSLGEVAHGLVLEIIAQKERIDITEWNRLPESSEDFLTAGGEDELEIMRSLISETEKYVDKLARFQIRLEGA